MKLSQSFTPNQDSITRGLPKESNCVEIPCSQEGCVNVLVVSKKAHATSFSCSGHRYAKLK